MPATVTNVIGATGASFTQATGVVSFSGVSATLAVNGDLCVDRVHPKHDSRRGDCDRVGEQRLQSGRTIRPPSFVPLASLPDVSVSLAMPATWAASTTASGTVTFYDIGAAAANNVTRSFTVSGGTVTVATGGVIGGGGTSVETYPTVDVPVEPTATFTFVYAVPATGTVNATATAVTTSLETSTANNTVMRRPQPDPRRHRCRAAHASTATATARAKPVKLRSRTSWCASTAARPPPRWSPLR